MLFLLLQLAGSLPPKPAAPPAAWRSLIGAYLSGHDTVYVYEAGGALFTRVDSVSSPVPRVADSVGHWSRLQLGPAGGGQLRIQPVRPVSELLITDRNLTPPAESGGSFLAPDLVQPAVLDSTIHLDIRYATTNNFLSSVFYSSPHAFLQRPAALAVVRASQALRPLGYGLLIHDAYRPWYVTKVFWDATPVASRWLVADPSKGSKHNRGAAVDITLYDLKTGAPVEMPSTYDEATPRAYADFLGGTSLQRWHRALLRRTLEAQGFTVNPSEWWHFDFRDWARYPILNIPFELLLSSGAPRDTTPTLCGAAPAPAAPDPMDRAVLSWLRSSQTPAAEIAIVQHGRITTERVYGWADLGACVPARADMRFGIGSISKQITALGVLVLVSQGKLSLDDSISRWLPESGTTWRGITVRHLLTHTSGIRDSGHDDPVYPQIEIDKKIDVTDSALVARLAADPLNFRPGEAWAYSNTGYLLLSIIIARVSGVPFPAWMHAHVFEPLGMHATRYFEPTEVVPALARGYSEERNGRIRLGYYSSRSYSQRGDMGIISTAHDMALWSVELDSSRLVSPALHALMLQPTRLNDGAAFPYGFGVILDDYRGEPVLRHSGTYAAGYSADLASFPNRGLSVVVLTNQHQGDPWDFTPTLLALTDSTLRSIASLRAEPDRTPERTRRLAALLNGDSTAAAATPAWRRLMYPQIRGFLSDAVPLTVDFITCDDVAARHIDRFGGTAALECYYRLRHDPMTITLSVLYTADGRITGMFPR